jgi:hypothetical protein
MISWRVGILVLVLAVAAAAAAVSCSVSVVSGIEAQGRYHRAENADSAAPTPTPAKE